MKGGKLVVWNLKDGFMRLKNVFEFETSETRATMSPYDAPAAPQKCSSLVFYNARES